MLGNHILHAANIFNMLNYMLMMHRHLNFHSIKMLQKVLTKMVPGIEQKTVKLHEAWFQMEKVAVSQIKVNLLDLLVCS